MREGLNRELTAHEELRAHLHWVIGSIRKRAPSLQGSSSEDEKLAFLYLLSSLGAGVYEFLWSGYYLKNAMSTETSSPFVKTDPELLQWCFREGILDLESQRAVKQLNDFRSLIKRPYRLLDSQWDYLSSVEWQLSHVEAIIKSQ